MSSPAAPIALVIHGHFYQPPRENPWTDQIPREPSAAPYHDWNERIHAESYRANAFARIHAADGRIESIVDNYERLSFNVGPTLARWIGRKDPAVMARLRAADEEQRRRLGAGGAIAQAYAHPIVPLCDPADRRTQLLWGLADFERRFGRPADGLWLPETAVSPATLATLIDLGVRYTILAPEQIDAVRASPDDDWDEVDRDSLDTGRVLPLAAPGRLGPVDRPLRVRRPDVAGDRLRRGCHPRREPARRRPRRGRAVEGRRAAPGAVRLRRRAVGAPQEVLRPDARLRDARRGPAARAWR